jgi:hypothetical protein
MTDPDIISSGRKTMPIDERGQAPTRGAFVSSRTFLSETSGTDGTKFEVFDSKLQTLQPSVFSLLYPIRLESSYGNPPF